MRNLSPILFILLACLFCNIAYSQVIRTTVPDSYHKSQRKDVSIYDSSWKEVSIPFQYINNLIVVDLVFEHTFPLRFVFDTGAEHSVLTERSFTDLLRKKYEREFLLYGADMTTQIRAYLVQNLHLKLHRLNAPSQSLLVLDKDYLNFGALAGIDIHGILGASFFKQFIVQINYEREVIKLIRPERFKIGKQWQMLDIEVFRGKPYINTSIDMIGEGEQALKLLVDTGAGLPLLLYTDTDSTLIVPPNAIKGSVGKGLGGQLEGFQGRVKKFNVGTFELGRVITNFQKLDSLYVYNKELLNGRNGIIGNEVLSRFDITIDYWKEHIYLRPNKRFKSDFEFDRSGLVIIASGLKFKTYNIQYVHPDSPADKAGFQRGDIIKSINGTPGSLVSLEIVNNILRKKVGKKIRIVLSRNETRIKKTFYLEEII